MSNAMNDTVRYQNASIATNYTIQYQNASNVQNFFNIAPNTLTLASGNLNWTNWTDTLSTLVFDRSKTGFAIIEPTLDNLFRPDRFSYPIYCAYPISGQYGFSVRLAYYLLLLFSLILRKQLWLSIAALGVAMAYGATTCVHAFALLVRYKFKGWQSSETHSGDDFGDLDMVPMLPILASGCIMLTPILNWSENLKRHHAQSVVVWWGVLMFIALIPVVINNWREIIPSIQPGIATCQKGSANCNLDSLTDSSIMSKTYYDQCQCNDTCGAASIPGSTFRKNSNLQAYLITDQVSKINSSDAMSRLAVINLIVLIFVSGQGVLGLIEVKFTQADVRNWMFRHLTGPVPRLKRQTFKSILFYHFAKWTAAGFFMAAIVVAVICPLVFASSVVVYEIITCGYPVSEYFDAIGQWNVWVSALFVIIAAIIQEYSHAWRKSVVLGFRTIQRLIKWAQGKGTFRAEATRQERNKDNSVVERTGHFFQQLASPFVHVVNSIANSRTRVELEWDDFMHWCADPIHASSLPPYHWRVYLPHHAEQEKGSKSKRPHRLKYAVEVHYGSYPLNDSSTNWDQQQRPNLPGENNTWPGSSAAEEPDIVQGPIGQPGPFSPPHSMYSLSQPKKNERRATEPVEPMHHITTAIRRQSTEHSQYTPIPISPDTQSSIGGILDLYRHGTRSA